MTAVRTKGRATTFTKTSRSDLGMNRTAYGAFARPVAPDAPAGLVGEPDQDPQYPENFSAGERPVDMGKVIHRGRDGQGGLRKYYRKKDGSLALTIEIEPNVIEFGRLVIIRDGTILDGFEDALKRARAALRASLVVGDLMRPSRSSRPTPTRPWGSCVRVWATPRATSHSHERRPRRARQRALARHFARLGLLSGAALAGRDQLCPACGGHDRFRFTDKGFGRWFCRGCGMGGDGLRLVQTIKRVDFQTAAALIETVVGKVDAPDARKNPDNGKSDKPSDPMKPWREAGPFLATRRSIDISVPAHSSSPRSRHNRSTTLQACSLAIKVAVAGCSRPDHSRRRGAAWQ